MEYTGIRMKCIYKENIEHRNYSYQKTAFLLFLNTVIQYTKSWKPMAFTEYYHWILEYSTIKMLVIFLKSLLEICMSLEKNTISKSIKKPLWKYNSHASIYKNENSNCSF